LNDCVAVSRTVSGQRIHVREPQVGDLGWVISRHGEVYASSYGWTAEFEALVASIVAKFATTQDRAVERCFIAEVDGQRAGCAFVVRNDDDPTAAQLRCVLVEPACRGLGVGSTLVGQCIDFAQRCGYQRMVLWTNDLLVSARKIYVAAGFTLQREERHHSFGHDMVGQYWALPLNPTVASPRLR
jgi:GNAT superfamily N-acetyltransferase